MPDSHPGLDRVVSPHPDRCTCSEAVLRLDEYVDRCLSEEELLRVEAHLADCVECAGEFRFEVALVQAIRARLRRIQVPPHLLYSVLRRLDAESPPS